jgi:hypothetical protein
MVKLPYTMKVGRKKVYVTLRARNGRRITGCYSPLVGALTVYTGHELRPRSDAAIRTTFFHELTHAVLYEMQHPLARDEKFVTEFARLLSGAVETAKFDDDVGFGEAPRKREGAILQYDSESDPPWPKKKK